MSPTDPIVYATAPFRGPGLDTPAIHRRRGRRPWIDDPPLRLYNAEQLAARIDREAPTILICESDIVQGPGARPAARRHRLVPRRPHQRRHRRRDREGHPRAARARAQRRRGRRDDVALLFAVNRHVLRADHDVRAGEVYRDGTIPYQRFRAWQLAGRTAGHRRARRGRAGPRSGASTASA